MNEKCKKFGNFIREIRKKKNISTYIIENNYGISSPQWSRIENGKQNGLPKPDLMLKISEILDINPIDLFKAAGYITEKNLDDYYETKEKF